MKRMIFTMAMGAMMAAGAFAQDPTIRQREINQQDRIANGVRNGTLTPRETSRLENREANLNREIRNDRRADNGHLTGRERAQVNRQQNRLSRSIYRDKHNGR
jgi:hypothetical protein